MRAVGVSYLRAVNVQHAAIVGARIERGLATHWDRDGAPRFARKIVAEAEWRMGRGQQLLVVFLDVEQTTVLRRRGEVAHNRARLPMGGDGADEVAEVGRLHYFLSEDARRLLAGAGVPYLSLRNDKDGEAAVEGRVARILDALRVV